MNNSIDFQINIGGNATVSLTNIANQFDEVKGAASRAEDVLESFTSGIVAFNQAFELAGNVSSVFQSWQKPFRRQPKRGSDSIKEQKEPERPRQERLEKQLEKC